MVPSPPPKEPLLHEGVPQAANGSPSRGSVGLILATLAVLGIIQFGSLAQTAVAQESAAANAQQVGATKAPPDGGTTPAPADSQAGAGKPSSAADAEAETPLPAQDEAPTSSSAETVQTTGDSSAPGDTGTGTSTRSSAGKTSGSLSNAGEGAGGSPAARDTAPATGGASAAASPQKPGEKGGAAAVVSVPGTRVTLLRPEGFEPATTFAGFQSKETGSSIMVTELPSPYSQLIQGFTAENLKKRHMELVSKEDVKIGSHKGILIQAFQAAFGKVFRKWVLTFGDESETVMITATFPSALSEKLSPIMRSAVVSATWDRSKSVDPLSGLSFSVQPLPEMKLARRVQNMLLFTGDGKLEPATRSAPLFIAGQSIGELQIGDKKAYCLSRLIQTRGLKDFQMKACEPVEIGGISGYEILAQAKDVQNNAPIFLYQVMLFEDKSYYILEGMVAAEWQQQYESIFRKLAQTFQRRE